MHMESFLYGVVTATVIMIALVVIVDSMIRAANYWEELEDEEFDWPRNEFESNKDD